MTAYPYNPPKATATPRPDAAAPAADGAVAERLGRIEALLGVLVAAVSGDAELDGLPWPDPGARTILEVLFDEGASLTREEIPDKVYRRAWAGGVERKGPAWPRHPRIVREHVNWLLERGLVEVSAKHRIAISGRGRRYVAAIRAAMGMSELCLPAC